MTELVNSQNWTNILFQWIFLNDWLNKGMNDKCLAQFAKIPFYERKV